MSKILISFATLNFYKSLRKLERTALKNGVQKVIKFNSLWLRRQNEFWRKNYLILNNKKGYGFWIWKPYIILHLLQKIKDEDFLVYSDAGIEFVSNISPLLEICEKENGLLLFEIHKRLCGEWTKRDCFFFMNCDTPYYYNETQVMGGFMVLKKNEFTIKFVSEWLLFSLDARIITDNTNTCGLPDLPQFISHRHDQSIISLLSIKYGVSSYRDPSQWGNNRKNPNLRVRGEFLDPALYGGNYSDNPSFKSNYPTILNIHRRRTYRIFPFYYIPYLIMDNYLVDLYLKRL